MPPAAGAGNAAAAVLRYGARPVAVAPGASRKATPIPRTPEGLVEALALIERLARQDGVRERIAVAARVEGWLAADEPVVLPDGQPWPEMGRALGRTDLGDGAPALWLLPGARLLVVAAGQPPEAHDLVDAPIDGALLADRLRDALFAPHVSAWRVDEVAGTERQVALAEWLSLAWRVDDASRAWLLDRLANAMRPDWTDEAARLKTGFERGLGDRFAPVRRAAARALVRMAVIGPIPAYLADHPEKVLDVVLAVPRADVRAEAFRALLALPAEALATVAGVVEPAARASLVHADEAVRDAAGALEAALSAGGHPPEAVGELASPDPTERVHALNAFTAQPGSLVALIPGVLHALDDPDERVRRAAIAACDPLLSAPDPGVRERVLTALLEGRSPEVVEAGVDALPGDPVAWPPVALPALRRALDGPLAARRRVAERLVDHVARMDLDAATEGYGTLLRNEDPVVRQVVLRRLSREAGERTGLRDRLTHDLVARLHGDPVPEVRAEVAEALVAMGFPNAAGLAAQLAADPDPVARNGALAVLRRAGDAALLRQAERTAAEVAILVQLPVDGDGDARMRWTRALEGFVTRPTPRRLDVLIGLLRGVRADATQPFARFAIGELDRHILALTVEGPEAPEGVASICRRLMDPAHPAPLHAARLAGAVAAEDARALALLWSLYTGAAGLVSEAARRAIAGLAGQRKSERVREWLADALHAETDPGRKDVLRTLLLGGR